MAGIDPVVAEWKRALGRACVAGDDEKVRSLLSGDSVDSKTRETGIQFAIQKATSRKTGKQSIALLLLNQFNAADLLPDDAFADILQQVVDIDDADVLRILLRNGFRPVLEANDKRPLHRTPFFSAALLAHIRSLEALLEAGADINAVTKNGQSVLMLLAAEKGPVQPKMLVVFEWLVRNDASIALKDHDQKNTLHWAAITGKTDMVRILLSAKPDVDATSDRNRTALHYAAAGDCPDDSVVDLLLQAGADPKRRSDGNWTPLHNAAQHGNLKVVERLILAGADVNATLSSRVTPLHWAAANGHENVVKCILAVKGVQKHKKDAFGSTPMIRAAQNNHKSVAKLFHPCNDGALLTDYQKEACKSNSFRATVVDFERTRGQGPPESRVKKWLIWDLLYNEKFTISANPYPSESKQRRMAAAKRAPSKPPAEDAVGPEVERSLDEKGKPPVKSESKIPDPEKLDPEIKKKFRWIHLPANNMAWAETLFNKLFIEEEAADVDGFKALQKSLGHQHRGRHVHSTFMIPHCSHTRPTASEPAWISPDGTISEMPEKIVSSAINVSTRTKESKQKNAKTPAERDMTRAKTRKRTPRKRSTISTGSMTPRHDSASEHMENESDDPHSDENEADGAPVGRGNIALFMPYLHFESHDRRLQMAETIKSVRFHESSEISSEAEKRYPEDVMLVKAYLDSYPSLHPRRTLDQFLYHSFDTEKRDVDQVVFRYFRDVLELPPKVYMVDQLWLWIWGEDLIVTCFPQRWGQAMLKNDPLCVLEGVIEDINSKTRPPVRSIHDLAMVVTGRCSGGFDRYRLGEQEYQFMDMFDSSIGDISVREPVLFERFERASSSAANWLREQQGQRETQKGHRLNFVNNLLEIKEETTLLKELKDIRDELNIIKSIFSQQHKVLKSFERAVREEQRTDKSEIIKRFREHGELTKLNMDDVRRMDNQAQAIFTSLTQLLDFKQKHANAIEARFAREQAEFTAGQADLTRKQGETIMIFTIVTIFFLPISFIAAFFTISIEDFPRLSLGYVSQYVFGIGLSISFILITVAFQVDRIRNWSLRSRESSTAPVRQSQVDETGMKTVLPSVAVQALQRSESDKFGPPPRILSGISALTGRSNATGAYSRHGPDPEWGE